MRKLIVINMVFLGIIAAGAVNYFSDGNELKSVSQKILKENINSIVEVRCMFQYGADYQQGFDGGQDPFELVSMGLVLTDDGLVITQDPLALNSMFHQNVGMGEVSDLRVVLSVDKHVEARLVAVDIDYGLLFVKMDLKNDGIKLGPIDYKSSLESVDPGEPVIELVRDGELFDYAPIIHFNFVSQRLTAPLACSKTTLLYPVSSSPVFRLDGRLVGIRLVHPSVQSAIFSFHVLESIIDQAIENSSEVTFSGSLEDKEEDREIK